MAAGDHSNRVMSPHPTVRDARSVIPGAHTSFVGRRPFEAAELYALTGDHVERLRPAHRDQATTLDWRGGSEELLALSHAVLSRIGEQRSSTEVERRFATFLARLPCDGFVIDGDEIERWLRTVNDELDAGEPARRSRARWLLSKLRR
jgi:hypothetical protein